MAVVKNNAALDVLMVKRFFLLHKVSLNDCVYFASPFLVNSFLPC